jgi:hypothetical protein
VPPSVPLTSVYWFSVVNLAIPAQVLGFTLINSTVALAGYYAAAFTVDKAWMGRRRMQVWLAAQSSAETNDVLCNPETHSRCTMAARILSACASSQFIAWCTTSTASTADHGLWLDVCAVPAVRVAIRAADTAGAPVDLQGAVLPLQVGRQPIRLCSL